MEKVTNFGMKNSLTLPSVANKNFNCLGDGTMISYKIIPILSREILEDKA